MKKMKFVKYVIAAIAVVSFVGLTGCAENVYDPDKDNNKEESDGSSNDFDFSTKKNVEINLKYDVPSGSRVYFEMYTKAPLTLDEYKSYVKDTTLVPFLSGRSDENGRIYFKGELPATVNEIYSYSLNIGVPILMKASVSSTGAISAFEVAEVLPATRTRSNNPSGATDWKTYNVTLKKPTLPAVSRNITKEDKDLIYKSFPMDQVYSDGLTYYRPSIQLNKEARVKIYSVSQGATSNRTNALAYFVYETDNKIQPEDINSNLQLAFPELNKKTPAEGQGYQLLYNGEQTFKAGSRIGFALFPDITPGNIETNNTHVLYSYFGGNSWNSYKFPGLFRANVPHMVLSLLRVDANGHAIIALGFEDQPFSISNSSNKGDFHDNMFIIEVDPSTSLPEDLPTPPTDEPSYEIEFKSSGILCFEDCWPAAGDYDINDVVISYQRNLCINGGIVAALKETYTFLHNGASFVNGFGVQFVGAKRTDVVECTVSSSYTCAGQGLDGSSTEANVMLFDNAKLIEKGTTFNVFTSFSGNALVNGVNPFIVVNHSSAGDFLAKGRIEVHLPTPKNAINKYLPTSKANDTYWGTNEDRSIPASNIYYVRKGNYPFALDINWDSSANGDVTNFVIPHESRVIDATYPKFPSWVESNGKNNADWFLHPEK